MVKRALFLILLLAGLTAQSHPLHLSFTTLEYQADTQSWKLMVKIFFDDLEESIYKNSGIRPDLSNDSGNQEFSKLLHKTVFQNLTFFMDDKEIMASDWELVKWEKQEDAVWLNFHFNGTGECHKIRVRNLILLNVFSDQKNLFILNVGSKEEAYQFSKAKKEFEFVVKPV